MIMINKIRKISVDSLKESFRNARFLYLPFLSQKDHLHNTSLMNGALPGMPEWNMYYGKPTDLEFEWKKFSRRHECAQERAGLYRSEFGNETLELVTNAHTVLISLLRPEIGLAGCVGTSMQESSINFMDLVATYPRTSDEMNVHLYDNGEKDSENEGTKIFRDFSIDIGGGVKLVKDSVAELLYPEKMTEKALEACPTELKGWAASIRKIRHIDYIKIDKNGNKFVGVSSNRNGRKLDVDHPFELIRGRVFGIYGRSEYEERLKRNDSLNKLSLGAMFVDFLRPNFNWDEEFGHLNFKDRQLVEEALLGDETNRRDALRILISLVPKQNLLTRGATRDFETELHVS